MLNVPICYFSISVNHGQTSNGNSCDVIGIDWIQRTIKSNCVSSPLKNQSFCKSTERSREISLTI